MALPIITSLLTATTANIVTANVSGVGDFGSAYADFDGLRVRRNSSTAGHQAGIDLCLKDSAGNAQVYAGVYGAIATNTSGVEDGELHFYTFKAGTKTKQAWLDKGGSLSLAGGLYAGTANGHLNLYSHASSSYGIAFNTYYSGSYRALTLTRPSLLHYRFHENSSSNFILTLENLHATGVFNMAIEGSLAIGSTSAATGSYLLEVGTGGIKSAKYYSAAGAIGVSTPPGVTLTIVGSDANDYACTFESGLLIGCSMII